jgi:hypothetical protein
VGRQQSFRRVFCGILAKSLDHGLRNVLMADDVAKTTSRGPRPKDSASCRVPCASCRVPWGPVVAEVRPLRVTQACSGGHKHPRDVSRSRQRGVSGQTGGFYPLERSLAGCVPDADDGWTPSKMCFKIPIRSRRRSLQAGLISSALSSGTSPWRTPSRKLNAIKTVPTCPA